jgi:hypothetical protein
MYCIIFWMDPPIIFEITITYKKTTILQIFGDRQYLFFNLVYLLGNYANKHRKP